MTLATIVYLVVFVLAVVEIGESRSRLALAVALLDGFLLVASVGAVPA